MNNEELKKYMKEKGCFLLHLGMLVRNIEETKKWLDCLYGIEGWFGDAEIILDAASSMVGPPAEFRVVSAKIFGHTDVELVEPHMDRCKGTAMADYLENHGEGLHHICYGIPKIEDFQVIFEEMKQKGYQTVLHAVTHQPDCDVEFCYLEPGRGGLFVELNCAMPKE